MFQTFISPVVSRFFLQLSTNFVPCAVVGAQSRSEGVEFLYAIIGCARAGDACRIKCGENTGEWVSVMRRGWETIRFILVLSLTVGVASAAAQTSTTTQQTPQQQPQQSASPSETNKKNAEADRDAAAAKKKAEEETRGAAALYQGTFRSDSLAGGADNEFRVPQPANRLANVLISLSWVDESYKDNKIICDSSAMTQTNYPPSSKSADSKDATKTTFAIRIPSPPCFWPLTQYAVVTVKAQVLQEGKEEKTVTLLESARFPVTTLWFPMTVTLLVLALIYPGGAAASWYASKRQYRKKAAEALSEGRKFDEEEPAFFASLDPVELTKNPWGRASIAKLQIFTFTFIIFGLLFFNVLRTGLLANMSTDVLYLMGISAVGAAGGKIAYVARRRLSMENWVWLRQQKWLPAEKDVQPHAKWSELFVDNSTKEFDPYRFQMAVFSLVVAIALITTSATGLEAFKVPPEMLGLLGISQVVFIGGQAMENGGFADLDKKLTEVRTAERAYGSMVTKEEAAVDAPGKAAAKEKADAEYAKFKTAVTQAKEMFLAVYGEQIGSDLPPELLNAEQLDPVVHKQ